MIAEVTKPLVRNLMTLKKATFAIAAASLMFASFGQADEVSEGVKERIAPVGELCMSGEPCAAAPAAPVASGPRSGKEIYDSKCTTCHAIGVSGAPKFGEAGDWGPRVAKGLDTLFDHAWNGFNAMPPKGLCLDCSEDEIKAGISYMVDNSK